jgi:endonuclease III
MSIKEKKKRLRRIVAVLKKKYGETVPREGRDSVETLARAVLARESTEHAVDMAYHKLHSVMADLNEARVATVQDLARALGQLHAAEAKAAVLKPVLEKIYLEKACLTADFIGEKTPAQAEAYLREVPTMPRETARLFLVDCFAFPLVPPDVHMRRTWERIGLVAAGLDENALCTQLEAICPRREAYEVYHTLRRHSDALCTPTPKCRRCPVRDLCETGQAPPVAAPKKKAVKPAAKPKKAKPKKPAKRKPTAGKKPAPARKKK